MTRATWDTLPNRARVVVVVDAYLVAVGTYVPCGTAGARGDGAALVHRAAHGWAGLVLLPAPWGWSWVDLADVEVLPC